jgi:hypothetical protein
MPNLYRRCLRTSTTNILRGLPLIFSNFPSNFPLFPSSPFTRPFYLSKMSFFASPPKPQNLLGYHRILSPTAAIKVSPISLGGISIGSEWSEIFGENEDPFKLLNSYYSLGGNFIDTSSIYNAENSEKLIGQWMEKRGVRDQMVVATKFTSGYRAYNREKEPLQSNFTGNSAKNMFLSVRDSLKKLRTDYIDILYVHWYVLHGRCRALSFGSAACFAENEC